MRSHEAKEVSDLAKELVKKWKNEVERAKGGSKAATNGKAAPGEFNPMPLDFVLHPIFLIKLARARHRSHHLPPPLPFR